MKRRRALAILSAALCLAGCREAPTAAPPAPRLLVSGRVERGLPVTLTLIVATDSTVVTDSATFTVAPTGAAEPLADGTVLLLAAGPVTVGVTLANGIHASTVLTVALPPSIVFDCVVGGNRDIYRVAIDGGDLQRLTTDPGDDEYPTAAAGRVVFTSYRNGNAELYAVSDTGGTNQRLTFTAANETQPALSPNGLRLAYVSDATGAGRVWVSAPDATAASPGLAADFGFSGSVEASPAWSPSSSQLVFLATPSGQSNLYTASPGGEPTLVVASTSASVEPAWSPDGTRIVFVSAPDGNDELYVDSLATGTIVRLTAPPAQAAKPAWLADGRIVYVATVGGVPRLRWIDPTIPGIVHDVSIAAGTPANPAPIF